MHTELASWKAKSLSLASGKKKNCEIGKVCRGFSWGDKEGKGKVHLINWKTLCQPKLEGGL